MCSMYVCLCVCVLVQALGYVQAFEQSFTVLTQRHEKQKQVVLTQKKVIFLLKTIKH